MSKSTTGSDPSARLYALILCGVVLGTYVISALAYNISPQSFYFRAYEYVVEVIALNPGLLLPAADWHGVEKGNISTDYFFHYQDSWGPTTVSMSADCLRKGGLPLPASMVVIGDSFAWGSGLSDEQTFSAQLSRRIGAGVLNAAWNPAAVARLPPDVASVIEIFEYGDIVPDFLRWKFASPEWVKPRTNFFSVVPVERYYFPAIAHRMLNRLRNDIQVGAGQLEQPLTNGYLRVGLTEQDADELVHLFVERAASFRRQGRDYAVVMVPRIFTVLATDIDDYSLHYYTRLSVRLNAAGVHAIDTLEAFEAHDAKSLYFRTDGHWNPKGAALGAEVAAAYLRERGMSGASKN